MWSIPVVTTFSFISASRVPGRLVGVVQQQQQQQQQRQKKFFRQQ
jgi:hypothetical protein